MMTPRPLLLVLFIGAQADASGPGLLDPPAAPIPAADAALPVAGTEALAPPKARPLGWLSDPGEPARDPISALFSGKIHFNNNTRIELADTTGRDSSTAITSRLRLGYESKPYLGFNGLIEMEGVITPDEGNFFVPATGDGSPGRTVVADPSGLEINQAYGRFSRGASAGSPLFIDLRAGRQRIQLDDDRFVGNVGWRQFEQTFDAVGLRTDLGAEGLSVYYAYVWGVQRIFGPDGPNPDSDSHLVNISYRFAPEVRAAAFAYLLDFEGDDPLNSSNSFGLRLTGDLWKPPGETPGPFADYELTYARQSDAGSNPVDYEADFFAAQIRVHDPRLGQFFVGYQFLGSDGGEFAFRFPLGTNHKFQGFADNFLVTPPGGLQDLYFGLSGNLPGGLKGSVIYHELWSDHDAMDLGEEVDFVLSKQITPNWSVLVKAAFYDGDSSQPDTSRVWIQTTFSF